MLAPDSSRAYLSYMTAWLTTSAWQGIAGTMGYLIATVLQGIIVLGQPQYEPKSWHTVLIAWAASMFAVLINSTTGRALAKFEGVVLVLHLAGFFGIIIPLVYLAPHNEPSAVFATFLNEGGWSSQALSVLVGFPSGASTLIGADCAVHMSEEVSAFVLGIITGSAYANAHVFRFNPPLLLCLRQSCGLSPSTAHSALQL